MNQRAATLWLLLGMVLLGFGSYAVHKPSSLLAPESETELTDLIVPSDAIPDGWRLDLLGKGLRNPPANHVTATWRREGARAIVEQIVWRAYSVNEARLIYQEMESHFALMPQIPIHMHLPSGAQGKIEFEHLHAGDSRLVCGSGIGHDCIYIARYDKYVISIRIPLQTESAARANEVQDGFSSEQVKGLITAVDTQFQDSLELPGHKEE